jgi:hypothetical protein
LTSTACRGNRAGWCCRRGSGVLPGFVPSHCFRRERPISLSARVVLASQFVLTSKPAFLHLRLAIQILGQARCASFGLAASARQLLIQVSALAAKQQKGVRLSNLSLWPLHQAFLHKRVNHCTSPTTLSPGAPNVLGPTPQEH